MKKYQRSSSGRRSRNRSTRRQYVSRLDQKRFQGDITTVLYNVAAAVIYAVFLYFTLDGMTGLITFFVLAIFQIIVCAILGINYNSKMWLLSALAIFLIGCVAFVYLNI